MHWQYIELEENKYAAFDFDSGAVIYFIKDGDTLTITSEALGDIILNYTKEA